jgi:hypothetical protein
MKIYKVRLDPPPGLRVKPKHGQFPAEAMALLARVEATLPEIDAGATITNDDTVIEAKGDIVGHLFATPVRVTLNYSGDINYHQILLKLQRVLAALEPLGYTATDEQVPGVVRHHPARAQFLRQFRGQFICPDVEFEEFLQDRVPAGWTRWNELCVEVRPRYGPKCFPLLPDIPAHAELSVLAVGKVGAILDRVVEVNDGRIRQEGLAEYMREALLRGYYRYRRGNGDWFPDDDSQSMVYRTSLGQEVELANHLRQRAWPGVQFDTPQLLCIRSSRSGFASRAAEIEALSALKRLLRGRGRDAGCPAPPAQIRTRGITAYGSCLRS